MPPEAEIEEEIVTSEIDDIGADIAAAVKEIEEPEDIIPAEPIAPVEEVPPAPATWTPAAKEEWKTMTPAARSEVMRREKDIEGALTRHDGDLRFGREIKDMVAPYMANIQATGTTPTQAIQEILKNDHFLRTASPAQKTAKFYELAGYYGVDISAEAPTTEFKDPVIEQLQQQISELRQLANPENLTKQLREQQEDATFKAELAAFASDPANSYFDQVRPIVAALIGNGTAGTLKEAYEMACMAKPEIRSTLLQKQQAEETAKQKAAIAAKRKAGVSVSGSPGSAATSTAKSTNSIEDDIREAMRSSNSAI